MRRQQHTLFENALRECCDLDDSELDFAAGLDNLLRSLHENDTATRGGDGTAAPGPFVFMQNRFNSSRGILTLRYS